MRSLHTVSLCENDFQHSGNFDGELLPEKTAHLIFILTGFEVPATIVISEKYRPPIALQLNRKLRGKFAVQYYGDVVFERALNSMLKSSEDKEHIMGMCRWLSILTDEHRKMMRAVCIKLGPRVPAIRLGDLDAASMTWGIIWPHRYDHCFDGLTLTLKIMSVGGEEQRSNTVNSAEARRFHESLHWFFSRDKTPQLL